MRYGIKRKCETDHGGWASQVRLVEVGGMTGRPSPGKARHHHHQRGKVVCRLERKPQAKAPSIPLSQVLSRYGTAPTRRLLSQSDLPSQGEGLSAAEERPAFWQRLGSRPVRARAETCRVPVPKGLPVGCAYHDFACNARNVQVAQPLVLLESEGWQLIQYMYTSQK